MAICTRLAVAWSARVIAADWVSEVWSMLPMAEAAPVAMAWFADAGSGTPSEVFPPLSAIATATSLMTTLCVPLSSGPGALVVVSFVAGDAVSLVAGAVVSLAAAVSLDAGASLVAGDVVSGPASVTTGTEVAGVEEEVVVPSSAETTDGTVRRTAAARQSAPRRSEAERRTRVPSSRTGGGTADRAAGLREAPPRGRVRIR
jgi:hypothetical protein